MLTMSRIVALGAFERNCAYTASDICRFPNRGRVGDWSLILANFAGFFIDIVRFFHEAAPRPLTEVTSPRGELVTSDCGVG